MSYSLLTGHHEGFMSAALKISLRSLYHGFGSGTMSQDRKRFSIHDSSHFITYGFRNDSYKFYGRRTHRPQQFRAPKPNCQPATANGTQRGRTFCASHAHGSRHASPRRNGKDRRRDGVGDHKSPYTAETRPYHRAVCVNRVGRNGQVSCDSRDLPWV